MNKTGGLATLAVCAAIALVGMFTFFYMNSIEKSNGTEQKSPLDVEREIWSIFNSAEVGPLHVTLTGSQIWSEPAGPTDRSTQFRLRCLVTNNGDDPLHVNVVQVYAYSPGEPWVAIEPAALNEKVETFGLVSGQYEGRELSGEVVDDGSILLLQMQFDVEDSTSGAITSQDLFMELPIPDNADAGTPAAPVATPGATPMATPVSA